MGNQCDKRVILLGKALTLNGDHYKKKEGQHDCPLVSLGYFDSIQIYPLPKSEDSNNWMQDLWEHSVSVSAEPDLMAHYHPLYIVSPPGMKIPDGFWEWNSPFLFVTLVHFAAARSSQEEQLAGSAFAVVEKDISDILSSVNAQKKEGKGLQAVCYQSVDLSDMVVIWKSNSLVAVLSCLNQLYLSRNIGDLHSICSFPFPEDECKGDNEIIPYVSFRFGTKDTDAAACFSEILHRRWPKWPADGGYFTTGTEDIDVTFQSLPLFDFLDLIRLWFEKGEINELFQRAFYESSTHLGVSNMNTPARGNAAESASALSARCEELFKKFQTLRKNNPSKDGQIGLSWCKSVSSQLSALANMSRICVLDRFCYLILDGVETFYNKIKETMEKGGPLPYDLLGRIQRFVRGWGTLEDQALRMDGQFIQSPGFSPTLYDIPVSLLEFYIAFTTRCIDLLQSPESSTRHHYGLFLMPKLCRRTKVEDIFQQDPPCDRLLYVDIPQDLLYDPKQILLQLCHEVSHYCGENTRCRQQRVRYFTRCCACLIAWYFKLNSRRAIERIDQDIFAALPKKKVYYMQDLVEEMKRCVLDLIQDERNFQNWIDACFEGQDGLQHQRDELQRNRRIILYGSNEGLQELSEDISRVSYLFEEGYADMSMMFLLGPTWEEYLDLYQQELEWLREKRNYNFQYAHLIERAAIVTWAAKITPNDDSWEMDNCSIKRDFPTNVDCLRRCLGEVRGPGERFDLKVRKELLPVEITRNIADYLSYCWEIMRTTGFTQGEQEFLKKTFDQVARQHCIGSKEFQRVLAEYEKKVLNDLRLDE